MSFTRIALLAGASVAFVFMLATVTANSEFVYAPESTWKEARDAGQDIAVAAWRSQNSIPAPTATSRIPTVSDASSSAQASSAPVASSAAPTASSASAMPAQSSSMDDGGDEFPDWAREWWERFGDGDGDDRGDRKGRKGKRD